MSPTPSGYRFSLLAVLFCLLIAVAPVTQAEDWLSAEDTAAAGPNLGGTVGLTGIDSIRGFVDSLWYGQWWDQLRGTAQPSATVIYGEDQRVEPFTLTDANLQRLAKAACIIVYDTEIEDNGDGTYSLSYYPWTTQGGHPVCSDERFVGQPRIGACSGFLVGEDVLVTAGHCMSNCGPWWFVFDYVMADSATPPPAVISADKVYSCVEILGRVWEGDLDYCVVRLDRPVVGRSPVPIRRSGLVDNGDSVVAVGHPNVLPMKLSGGAIVQNNNGAVPWFQTNTDTYGGSSGSMVVNTGTWEVEGILVRGAPDFDYDGECVRSNVVPDYGNVGSGLEFEEVTKSTSFESLVPALASSAGVVVMTETRFGCSDTVGLEVRDSDLAGTGSVNVLVTTAVGDSETVMLAETAVAGGTFRGEIQTEEGSPTTEDGLLQVVDEDTVTLTYYDADDGTGSPAVVMATASIDCTPPEVYSVQVVDSGGIMATVAFTTSEPASATIHIGSYCGESLYQGWGGASLEHQITITELPPATSFRFSIEVRDGQGNTTTDDNGGACYQFSTTPMPDYFTHHYTDGNDLSGLSILFTPDSSLDFYRACLDDAGVFDIDTTIGVDLELPDDAAELISLTGGKQVQLYGKSYDTFYVCSNGFLNFGAYNVAWMENLEDHLGLAPRVSVWWDDLDPTAGGSVRYAQLKDRVVVMWTAVPEANKISTNTFLAELYYDGAIRLTYLHVSALDGIVGLSEGSGRRLDYTPSDFTAYDTCPAQDCCMGGRGNINCGWDQVIDVTDLQVLIDHMFLSLAPLCCKAEADLNLSDSVDITDVQLLIDHMFLSLSPLPDCR